MNCPKCGSANLVKYGFQQGHQRHHCRDCTFTFTKGFKGKPESLKQLALQLYLEGMGFRAIGRVLEVSNVAVLKWVRAYGKKAEVVLDEQPRKEIKTLEMDAPLLVKKKLLLGLDGSRPGKRAVRRSSLRLPGRGHWIKSVGISQKALHR